MTKRKQEQLARLLAEKEQEERHDHEYFAEVRRRRDETLHVLGVHAGASEVVQRRAAEAGISIEQMIRVVDQLPTDWIQQTASRP